MIATSKLSVRFKGRTLFDEVSVQFTQGNCYGLIGANGTGKSTFLKVLNGDLEAQEGEVILDKGKRISTLAQNHFAFDEYTVRDTVLRGHATLYALFEERDALYEKEDFGDADGIRAGEIEEQIADMNGYEAEADAEELLSKLGIPSEEFETLMSEMSPKLKVKILLARALFGNPDILLLDEPTNHIDLETAQWLEEFLFEFENTVIVVSHDRHFLNKVCTHIADLDYGKITIYTGNYSFWLQASELSRKQAENQRQKNDDKIKELQTFVQRFSANASKAKQATSRKKLIDKLTLDELPVSTRRPPFIQFKPNRACGDRILRVRNLTVKNDAGETLLDGINFDVNPSDKIAFVGEHTLSTTAFFDAITDASNQDEGPVEWGQTITYSYLPSNHDQYFENPVSLMEWLRPFSDKDSDDSSLRAYLGRMLFSQDEAKKMCNVLSGGEKMRCMFAKMMREEANALVFDNPTDHLDLEAISALNDGFIQFPEIILFSTHDQELINTVATRVVEVHPDKIVER